MMNDNVIVLTRYNGYVLFVLRENGRAVEYQLFSDKADAIGSIFVCEIKDVVRNLNASFVNYGNGRTGFLKTTKYKQGALVPLQLIKQGTKDKAPVFTDELSLAGVYTVVTNGNTSFSISKKIDNNKRNELREDYYSFFCDLEYGITLRTNSAQAGLKEVLTEADELAGYMDDIIANGDKRTVGTVLYQPEHEWTSYCYKTDILSLSKLITDDIEIFEVISDSVLKKMHELNPDVVCELYDDNMLSLNRLYSINTGLEEAISDKVWLKSGGFLYIETTQALTAIDVNTGKNTSGKDKETAFYELNLEATDEICRQIRLRGLGGIIIIDYINMSKAEHINGVVNRLKQLVRKDPVRTEYHDMTALSLVELTRMKIREPLKIELEKAGYGEIKDG